MDDVLDVETQNAHAANRGAAMLNCGRTRLWEETPLCAKSKR